MPKRVVVIGGGAAGLMAAGQAAECGACVQVLEKMDRVGRKLGIAGKGRCNITNSASLAEFVQNYPGNGNFLYSAFHQFFNQDLVAFFERHGVKTKVERGGRVFPVSDQAADIVNAMEDYVVQAGARIHRRMAATRIAVQNGKVTGVKAEDGTFVDADSVIVATGGASYPGTGSSGDGYLLVKQLGHTVTPLRPSLVPLVAEEGWVQELQGLSLRNVQVTAVANNKLLGREFGEMLFTHYGVSGPVILSLSAHVARYLHDHSDQTVLLEINLKPALTDEQLDARLQRDFVKFARKQFKNSLGELLPAKLIPVVIDLCYINPDQFVHQITRVERQRLADGLRHLTVTITGTRPIAEAIVTAGGVAVREVSPQTMESKLVQGLYFAGEVLDVDGYTGGFNLQAAFSTGYVAGMHAV